MGTGFAFVAIDFLRVTSFCGNDCCVYLFRMAFRFKLFTTWRQNWSESQKNIPESCRDRGIIFFSAVDLRFCYAFDADVDYFRNFLRYSHFVICYQEKKKEEWVHGYLLSNACSIKGWQVERRFFLSLAEYVVLRRFVSDHYCFFPQRFFFVIEFLLLKIAFIAHIIFLLASSIFSNCRTILKIHLSASNRMKHTYYEWWMQHNEYHYRWNCHASAIASSLNKIYCSIASITAFDFTFISGKHSPFFLVCIALEYVLNWCIQLHIRDVFKHQ